jgi:hypothetical protein
LHFARAAGWGQGRCHGGEDVAGLGRVIHAQCACVAWPCPAHTVARRACVPEGPAGAGAAANEKRRAQEHRAQLEAQAANCATDGHFWQNLCERCRG